MRPLKVLSCAAVLLVALLPASNVQGQVTFPGPELLGRPTDHSVTINVVASAAIQAYFEYGTQSGVYTQTNPASGAAGPASTAANVPLVVVLSGLSPNTQYFYKMVYRQTGTSSWITRAEHSFHTQRLPGSTFTFTVASDSHINIVFGNSSLYKQTLTNVAGENPDFHLDLGDTFAMDNVTTQAQANSSYLNLRSYFGLISPSVPIFLALGNHEQEEGWHLDDTGNIATSPPVMSANARNQYYLNPDPLLDPFYTGNTDVSTSAIGGDHAIEDYYAWQWGDALFVVIDPYWYTTTKPYVGNEGGGESSDAGSGDRWDWTLGLNQYLWLKQTLENSAATYKFIFAHQVAGGMDDYGRGGANAVPFVEWGGHNDDGTTAAFGSRRPGWPEPTHQLLVDNRVTAFFHGHDHEFAYEKRDGVVYQLVPMAADATYGYGFQDYHETDPYTIRVLPNSGHLRVTVSPSQVTVDYVRAFLSGAGTNGQVAYTYTMAPPETTPDFSVSATPRSQTVVQGNPTSFTATVGILNGFNASVSLGVTGLPSGAAGTFTLPSITGPGSSTLNVTTSPTTPAGTYMLTITGNGGNLNHSATITLVVSPPPDFSLSTTPSSRTVAQGSSTSYTVAVGALNGFTAAVGLGVAGLPGGAAGAFSPASVTGSGGATLNVTTSSTTPTGAYTLTITGTSGSLSHSANVTLVVSPPSSFTPVRINCGGPAYTDSLGQGWTADTRYTGGGPYTVTTTVTNTADPTLYKTARYGASFSYTIPAPAGTYAVTLKFAELYWTAANGRVFNVAINGTKVLSNFDIFAAAGAAFKAVDKTFTVTSSGTITIQFTQGSAGNPLVNAMQVVASAP